MLENENANSNPHPDFLSEKTRTILHYTGLGISGAATFAEMHNIGLESLGKIAKNIAFFALSDPERSIGFTLSNIFELVEQHPTENIAIALGIGLMVAASLSKGATRQKIEDAFFCLDDRWDDMAAQMHSSWSEVKKELTSKELNEDKWTHGPNFRR